MGKDVQGLTVVFTGDGKGKTSAAIGVVLRSLGHSLKCKMIQFIKGTIDSGEIHIADKFGDNFKISRVGKGFTTARKYTQEEHKEAAQKGIEEAVADMEHGVDLLVLDEILYALGKDLVSLEQILEIIDMKPAKMHLILTGRGLPKELEEKADLVTTMQATKHPFTAGIPAQKGLDY